MTDTLLWLVISTVIFALGYVVAYLLAGPNLGSYSVGYLIGAIVYRLIRQSRKASLRVRE